MMDVLEVYERPYDKEKPVVCVDEKSVPLREEARPPIPSQPGSVKKKDYEYVRNGTANIFIAVEPKGNHRELQVTKRRTKPDFAKFIASLVERTYSAAEKIVVVLDNLNTHFEKSFTETFSKEKAEQILKRLEFHYTPKHASWLNMAEIELSILSRQCLNRSIGTQEELRRQTTAWRKKRNRKGIGITWRFTQEKAKEKFNLP